MSQTCLVKFAEHTQARAAVRRLLQDGIAPGAMEVMSSQPIHGEPFIPEQKPNKLRTWAICGAGVGLLGGLSLATITALNYPLVKGGMPIVAPWTVGLIAYETTMLGSGAGDAGGIARRMRTAEFQEPALRSKRRRRRRRPRRLVSRRIARVGRKRDRRGWAHLR